MMQTTLSSTAPGVRHAMLRWAALLIATALAAACGGGDAPPAADQSAAAPAGGAPPPSTATTETVDTPPVEQPAEPVADTSTMSIADLLKTANAAVSEERLVAPAGNNAIEYYVAVIKQDANNVQAMQALVDYFPSAASIAERAVQTRDVAEAERIVALLDQASPGSYTVTTLKTKLEALKQTIQREADQQVAAEQRAAEQRVAEERAAAEAAAEPAKPAPPTPAPRRDPPPTQVAAATPPPATTAPTPPPAPAAPAVTNAEVVRQVPPQYPPDAYRRRQEGWVELEFTIGADGKVRDVRVARAQPTRVFDREAIRAMQQWTFKPAQRNGQSVDSPGRRRIEFKL
jgi:protein TonB